MFRTLFLLIALVVLLCGANEARAGFAYSNGAPSLSGGGVDLGISVGAESFNLSSTTTIRAARFFSYEYWPLWDGTLNYFFFGNNGVFPASSVLPGGQGSSPQFTKTFLLNGSAPTSIAQYDFDLITPLTLGPGTYWLGIQLDGDFSHDGVAWVRTTTPNAQVSAAALFGDFNQWTLQGSQLAFAISDTLLVVPEPSAVALTGFFLITVICRKRRW